MYDKVLTIFLVNKRMTAIRATKLQGLVVLVLMIKTSLAYFTENLTFGTIVFVEIRQWCTTTGTTAILGDITFTTTPNSLYSIVIAFFIVLNEGVVIPYLIMNNLWEDISLEFLILWGMNIIMSPLTKGNVFRKEKHKPTNLLILVLNY
jgi:hypothetical protein